MSQIPPQLQPMVIQTKPASNSSAFVLGSIIALAVIGAGTIVIVSLLRPKEDNTALIASILGFIAPTTAALLALVKSTQAGAAVQELRLDVNHRLSQLLEQTAKAAKSEGRDDALAAAAAIASATTAAVAPAIVAAVASPAPAPAVQEPPKS